MKRNVFLTALTAFLLAFALTLGACGGGASESTPSGESQSSPGADQFFAGVTFEDAIFNFNGSAHSIEVGGTVPAGTEIEYQGNTATDEGTYQAKATLKNGDYVKTMSATLTVVEPTAEQVVAARANTVSQTEQGFDYRYRLAGQLSVLGFESGEAEGIYTGQYRENKTTGEYTFKRSTSGLLLIDSVKYAYSKGNQRIVVKVDDDGSVKKIYNETVDEQASLFVHKPMEELVNHIAKENIQKIERSSEVAGYKYKAELKFTSGNVYIDKVLAGVSSLGTTVSIKGAEIPNLANGIQLYFNYGAGDRIEDFYVAIDLSITVKAVKTGIRLSYEQNGAKGALQVPTDENFIVDGAGVAAKVQLLSDALQSLKTEDAYSLDISAKNELDPSWKILATVDKYEGRLFKNTKDGQVSFNHSYEFKAHHEEDGAETYKYTLGNVVGDEAGVYLVSRKGKNEVAPAKGTFTADTQFDLLTSMAVFDADSVDCIRVEEKGKETVYKIYLNKASVLGIQKKIVDLINSNDAAGVLDVDNYLNTSNYIFEEALVEVKFENGALRSIECETEIHYTPVGGEYTDYNVTLVNEIVIEINENLEDAEDYKAPSSTGTLLGIGAAKYYIL